MLKLIWFCVKCAFLAFCWAMIPGASFIIAPYLMWKGYKALSSAYSTVKERQARWSKLLNDGQSILG